MERNAKNADEGKIAYLTATLDSAQKEQQRLRGDAAAGGAGAEAAADKASAAIDALDAQKQITARALAQVDILNQQIAALRKQLAAIQDALDASQTSDREVAGQDRRSRPAAQRRARAEGAGTLALPLRLLRPPATDPRLAPRHPRRRRPLRVRILGAVRIRQGRSERRPGRQSLDSLAAAVLDLEREIPPDIPWILRIDGHTDSKAISGGPFKSNWELSSARAIAVVQYLVSKGVDPHFLAAAGFGEFQPIDNGTDDEALARNRRIELKLTER